MRPQDRVQQLRQFDDGERLRSGQGLWHEEFCRNPAADEMLALRREGRVADYPFAAAAAAAWITNTGPLVISPPSERFIISVGLRPPCEVEFGLLRVGLMTSGILAPPKRGFFAPATGRLMLTNRPAAGRAPGPDLGRGERGHAGLHSRAEMGCHRQPNKGRANTS